VVVDPFDAPAIAIEEEMKMRRIPCAGAGLPRDYVPASAACQMLVAERLDRLVAVRDADRGSGRADRRRRIFILFSIAIAGASNGSTTTRSSSNDRACAISSPCAFSAKDDPSRSGCRCLHLVRHEHRYAVPRAIAASISRLIPRFACQNGDDDRLMCTAGCCRISSSIGSTL